MPRRDGTGPIGQGSMTGRGLGICAGENQTYYGIGLGLGHRRSFGRCLREDQSLFKTPKELLQEQKSLLKNRIDVIDKRLKNL